MNRCQQILACLVLNFSLPIITSILNFWDFLPRNHWRGGTRSSWWRFCTIELCMPTSKWIFCSQVILIHWILELSSWFPSINWCEISFITTLIVQITIFLVLYGPIWPSSILWIAFMNCHCNSIQHCGSVQWRKLSCHPSFGWEPGMFLLPFRLI